MDAPPLLGHFYEVMVLRLLQPGVLLHAPDSTTLLAGWDVDGAFDSFRADHGDRCVMLSDHPAVTLPRSRYRTVTL
jgi:hypothetical protein